MKYFPQLTTGAGVEYPVRVTRRWYREENELEGGERMYVPGPNYRTIEWQITFQDLSDDEVSAIRQLYIDSKGTYGAFTFVDPLINLFSWSEDLAFPAWQPGLMSCVRGAVDPKGGAKAWTISNPSEALQKVTQSVSIPSAYLACMSVWLRADAPATAYLLRDNTAAPCEVKPAWTRVYHAFAGSESDSIPTFGIGLAPGASVEAYGFQLEVQPYPSTYNATQTRRGMFPQTRFKDGDFYFHSEGPGRTSCDISLMSLY